MMSSKRDRGRGELTPIERRRLEKSFDILENPVEGIAYQHTVLCQTCLPYRNPGDIKAWERRQGAVYLRVEAGAVRNPAAGSFVEVGLPYGSRPRLILAHLNREALLRGSPRIEVERSLTAFVRRVTNAASPNTREIGRFKEQLTRFAAAVVRMSVDLPHERAYQVNTHIIDAFELWFEKGRKERVMWPEVVELSPRYFESLTAHAVPLDERAIGALANSPMALDMYAWLAQRLCRIKRERPQFISWANLRGQFGQEFRRMDHFKEHFRIVAAQVKAQYRGARFELDEQGMILMHSPSPVSGRLGLAGGN